jgi:hypothetical protein
LNHYLNRIDVLSNEAEDLAADLPVEATEEEIRADDHLADVLDGFLVRHEWISAIEQEMIRGKPLNFSEDFKNEA